MLVVKYKIVYKHFNIQLIPSSHEISTNPLCCQVITTSESKFELTAHPQLINHGLDTDQVVKYGVADLDKKKIVFFNLSNFSSIGIMTDGLFM